MEESPSMETRLRRDVAILSSQYALKITDEQAMEMPMVDLAFLLLKAINNPLSYRELMGEIARIKGYSNEEVNQVISQLYTEINIDGRFACVGANLWGLKRWYPVEKSEDPVGNAGRPRIINDEDDDLDDEDLFEEEEDEDYNIDEDSEELFEDEEEVPEIDEEMDEELDDEIIEENDDAEMEEDNLEEDDYDEEDDIEVDEDEDEEK